jgi:hypothetical protein
MEDEARRLLSQHQRLEASHAAPAERGAAWRADVRISAGEFAEALKRNGVRPTRVMGRKRGWLILVPYYMGRDTWEPIRVAVLRNGAAYVATPTGFPGGGMNLGPLEGATEGDAPATVVRPAFVQALTHLLKP